MAITHDLSGYGADAARLSALEERRRTDMAASEALQRRGRSAVGLLEQAKKHQEARAATYDKPGGERSMAATVAMFNAAKGREVLTEADGWLLQTLLKIVRDQANGPHRDSIEDGVSYFSLYGEARLK